MIPFKNNMIVVVITAGMLTALTGCAEFGQPIAVPIKPVPVEQKTDAASLNRFRETTSDGQTAIDTAIELSNKYATLTEEAAKLKMEKLSAERQNIQLKDRVQSLETELTQTQKELSEANDLLIEMRLELNNWKQDVLGFRDEMRQAEKAQLEALLKILHALGADTEDNSLDQDTPAKQTN